MHVVPGLDESRAFCYEIHRCAYYHTYKELIGNHFLAWNHFVAAMHWYKDIVSLHTCNYQYIKILSVCVCE